MLQRTWDAAPSPQPPKSQFTLLLSYSFISAKHLHVDCKLIFVKLEVKHMLMCLWICTVLPPTLTNLNQCLVLEMMGVYEASCANQELRKGERQMDQA